MTENQARRNLPYSRIRKLFSEKNLGDVFLCNVFNQWPIQIQFTSIDQIHNGKGKNGFGERSRFKNGFRRYRFVSIDVCDPITLFNYQFSVTNDCDREPGNHCFIHDFKKRLIKISQKCIVHITTHSPTSSSLKFLTIHIIHGHVMPDSVDRNPFIDFRFIVFLCPR